MAVEVNQFPNRDTGTGKVKESGPVTVEDPVDPNPTGAAQQQPDEVTVTSTEHADGPTGQVKETGPVTTTADWPTPEIREKQRKARSSSKATAKGEGKAETKESSR